MSKDGYSVKILIIDDLENNKQVEKKEHWAIKERKKRYNGENKFSISKGFTVSADELIKIREEHKNVKNQG